MAKLTKAIEEAAKIASKQEEEAQRWASLSPLEQMEERLNKALHLVDMYELSPETALYFSIRRKCNEIAISLNEFELQITHDKDDKKFERFMSIMDRSESMFKTLVAMRREYLELNEEDDTKEIVRRLSPLERRIFKKKNGISEDPNSLQGLTE